MKRIIYSIILAISVSVMLPSCASIFTKSNQKITFKGTPGSSLYIKGKRIGEIQPNGFANIPVRKRLKSQTVLATLDGYAPREGEVKAKFNAISLLNIIFGGVPGFAIDLATGKMCKYSNDVVNLTLTPIDIPAIERPEDIAETPQRVNRNNAGQTDMERTIVRWFFDSDPRGARIFYRVISNVPDEVKNTNESYLSTTPIEETKSFNIPGLTYDNARNVTIEIKVTKRGYEDQVKRYNVRQALDQQEITGFFELVPKE